MAKDLVLVTKENEDIKVIVTEDTEALVGAYHLLTDAVRRQLADYYLKKYGDDIDRPTSMVLANSKLKDIQTARFNGRRGGQKK